MTTLHALYKYIICYLSGRQILFGKPAQIFVWKQILFWEAAQIFVRKQILAWEAAQIFVCRQKLFWEPVQIFVWQANTLWKTCANICLEANTFLRSCANICLQANTFLRTCANICLQANTRLRSCANICLQANTPLRTCEKKLSGRQILPWRTCANSIVFVLTTILKKQLLLQGGRRERLAVSYVMRWEIGVGNIKANPWSVHLKYLSIGVEKHRISQTEKKWKSIDYLWVILYIF